MKTVNAFQGRCSLFTIGISIAIRAKIKRNDAVARANILNLLNFVKWTPKWNNMNGKWEEKLKKKKNTNWEPNQELYHMFTWIQACHLVTDFVFYTWCFFFYFSFFSCPYRNVLFRFSFSQTLQNGVHRNGFCFYSSRHSIAQSVTVLRFRIIIIIGKFEDVRTDEHVLRGLISLILSFRCTFCCTTSKLWFIFLFDPCVRFNLILTSVIFHIFYVFYVMRFCSYFLIFFFLFSFCFKLYTLHLLCLCSSLRFRMHKPFGIGTPNSS